MKPLVLISLLTAALSAGCVLDRTGQSATEAFRRDMVLHATRLNNLETQFDNLEARTSQLEEVGRARGQDEIMRMESLDDLRGELARLRGDVEVLNHNTALSEETLAALSADASFRMTWLEDRAALLEENLGVAPAPPPELPDPSDAGSVGGDGGSGEAGNTAVTGDAEVAGLTDPDALIARAEAHLAAGREKPAEAVLSRFLELHPEHERVPEALYRRAEAAFNAGDYAVAVRRFQEVIDDYKDSAWASWAMLRQGECFEAQDEPENAKVFYKDVVRIWPGSKAAREAKKKLD